MLMTALPPERNSINRPFKTTGVDFAGPFDIKTLLFVPAVLPIGAFASLIVLQPKQIIQKQRLIYQLQHFTDLQVVEAAQYHYFLITKPILLWVCVKLRILFVNVVIQFAQLKGIKNLLVGSNLLWLSSWVVFGKWLSIFLNCIFIVTKEHFRIASKGFRPFWP